MIKVLIVDDSRVVQEFMIHLLSSVPEIQVIGIASSGIEAIQFVHDKHPDIITMDIHMQGMDGLEATRVIMETVPTPIVIVSGTLSINDMATSFKLFEAGALAIVLRPPGMDDPEFADARKQLIQTIKLMSEVKVVRRFPKQGKNNNLNEINKQQVLSEITDIQVIAIGASTGGPIVLQTILSNLPKDLPVPVMIVQHIAKGFVGGFTDWLSGTSNIPLSIAKDGELGKPGNGYIAPDDLQMGLLSGGMIKLYSLPPDNGLCPSVDFLFRSVAEAMGPKALGILLSGMGKDGANGLKMMKDRGAITLVQNEASCVVFGMPGEAVKIKAADQVLSPEKIAEFITALFKVTK